MVVTRVVVGINFFLSTYGGDEGGWWELIYFNYLLSHYYHINI